MTSNVLFNDISGEGEPDIVELESLCLNCHEQGTTRLLLTRIPFFRDVIVSSFTCNACGFNNRSLDRAGEIQDTGIRYTLQVKNAIDMNRRMIQNSGSVVTIPHLDATFPLSEGCITTVEGSIKAIIENLESLQPARKEHQPEIGEKVDLFIEKMKKLFTLSEEFTLVLEDISGNSHLENLCAPDPDPQLKEEHFKRSHEQDIKLGLATEDETSDATVANEVSDSNQESFDPKNEVISFQINCPECNAPCESNMKVLDIPHFKEVIIMATVCDACGHRDNEVKGGAGIAEKGTRLILHLTDPADLTRDLLKSDTASVLIPELHLATGMGTVGGRFTTVEGLLTTMRDQLGSCNPFTVGDSANEADRTSKINLFLAELNKVIAGEKLDVHLVLDDPAGNSYIQNFYAPEPDPELKVEEYERDYEQNELLGLNDMKTENYT